MSNRNLGLPMTEEVFLLFQMQMPRILWRLNNLHLALIFVLHHIATL